jgi:hypothetical protein
MKKLLKKKVNVFGKSVPVFLIAILGMALVTAALLPYFGKITGMVTATQGLLVDGLEWEQADDISYSATTTSLENPVILSVHYLKNEAGVDAEVNLNYACSGAGSCSDIKTEYYETNLRSGNLTLSKKDSSWNVITEDTDVVVTYSTNVATGVMTVDSIIGLPEGYTLIYYVDEEFADDGTRLATPGKAYALSVGGVIPISQNDGNLKEAANYCNNEIDNYDHCRGIKLWAVRTTDLSGNTITWNSDWQSSYYFETDMLGWNHNNPLESPVDVASNSELDFVIVSEFPQMTYPGTYTITTTVEPHTA